MFIFLVSASLTQQVIVRSSCWMLSCSRCQIINSTIRCRMITQYLSFGPRFFYICAPCSYPILTGKKCKNAWPVSTQEMGSTFCTAISLFFAWAKLLSYEDQITKWSNSPVLEKRWKTIYHTFCILSENRHRTVYLTK